MYLLAQKYKDDEHQLTQLLHLLNPLCYFLLSLKIDVATSLTGARFGSPPLKLFCVSITYTHTTALLAIA